MVPAIGERGKWLERACGSHSGQGVVLQHNFSLFLCHVYMQRRGTRME